MPEKSHVFWSEKPEKKWLPFGHASPRSLVSSHCSVSPLLCTATMPTKRPVELTKEAPSRRYTAKAPPPSAKSDSSRGAKAKALCHQKKFQAPPPVKKDGKVKDKKEKKDSKDKEKAKKQDKAKTEKKHKKEKEQVDEKVKQNLKHVEKAKSENQKAEKKDKLKRNLAPDFEKEVEGAGRKAMKADLQSKLAALKKASERNVASDEDESGAESLSAALQPLIQARQHKSCPDEDEDEESDADGGEEEGSAGSEEDEDGDEDEDDSDFEDESDDEDEPGSSEESAEEEEEEHGAEEGGGRKSALRRASATSGTSTTPTPATPAASEDQVNTNSDFALVAQKSEKSTQLVLNSFLALNGSMSVCFSVHSYQASSTEVWVRFW